jgi:hypothetical protein
MMIPEPGTVVLTLEGECPFCLASFEVDVQVGARITHPEGRTRVSLNIPNPYGLHSCEVKS